MASGWKTPLDVLQFVPNSQDIVARHMNSDDDYPIRVHLTRPLTSYERAAAEDRLKWRVTDDEITLIGKLENWATESRIDQLLLDVRWLETEGKRLQDVEDAARERERGALETQTRQVDEINQLIEQRRRNV